MNSRFMRAMFASLMLLGHSAAQAPVLVQLPNPSSSILATMARARRSRSTAPWGRRESCAIFAETKSIAEPFLQAATQAPQPIQLAESMASSAITFEIGSELASCAPPQLNDT